MFRDAAHFIVNTCTNCPPQIGDSMHRRSTLTLQMIVILYSSFGIQLYTPQTLVSGNPDITLLVFVNRTYVFIHQLL